VGRTLKQLGIEHIPGYSPQARGRSERAFLTLENRLPKELKLGGIDTTEAANCWLSEVYIAEHNRMFAIEAEQVETAFVADTNGLWRDILCIQEDRVVGNDNTVKWQTMSLQLPPSPLRPTSSGRRFGCMNTRTASPRVSWNHRLADYNASSRHRNCRWPRGSRLMEES
jgi:hypothetical protein